MIENTIKAVHRGNESTNQTQNAFQEQMGVARNIKELINEIAAASSEQSHGISQVNIAVAEMDKVTADSGKRGRIGQCIGRNERSGGTDEGVCRRFGADRGRFFRHGRCREKQKHIRSHAFRP